MQTNHHHNLFLEEKFRQLASEREVISLTNAYLALLPYKHSSLINRALDYLMSTDRYQKNINKFNTPDRATITSPYSQESVVHYLKLVAHGLPLDPLLPDNDIAHSIVSLISHYDFLTGDPTLYRIWDLATELETPLLTADERTEKWDKLLALLKAIS